MCLKFKPFDYVKYIESIFKVKDVNFFFHFLEQQRNKNKLYFCCVMMTIEGIVFQNVDFGWQTK